MQLPRDFGASKSPSRSASRHRAGMGHSTICWRPSLSRCRWRTPGELALIFRSKQKNDRFDAQRIAKLLHLDEVPRVHVPSVEVRAWRGMIEHRRRLVDKRTRVKNALRAQLRSLGIKAPARRTLWSKAGIEWLEAQSLPTGLDRIKRGSLLAELGTLDEQIKIVERELNLMGKEDWRVLLLQTMPGVGPRTAEAAAAYIDAPERFGSNKSIGTYFGVIPSQDASAGKNRLGHITREGPATVRKMVTEAAWQAIRRSPRFKAFYERVMAGQKQRRATAIVATAHKMLRIMLSMLRSRQPWRDESAPAAVCPPDASVNDIETARAHRRIRGADSSWAGA